VDEADEDVDFVDVFELVVDVFEMVVDDVFELVTEVEALETVELDIVNDEDPVLITRLYADVVRVPVPELGSVPACAVTRYCEVLTPSFVVRYLRKRLMSPLKLVIVPLAGRKE